MNSQSEFQKINSGRNVADIESLEDNTNGDKETIEIRNSTTVYEETDICQEVSMSDNDCKFICCKLEGNGSIPTCIILGGFLPENCPFTEYDHCGKTVII